MSTPTPNTPTPPRNLIQLALLTVRQWFDSDYFPEGAEAVRAKPDRFELRRCLPFVFIHSGCIGVFWTGWSGVAVGIAIALYLVRMFAITGFYHRYFSHRTFRTSRWAQFLFAVVGNSAVQRGPLWWASVHRHHHKYSDQPEDSHSPVVNGFWWSHIGWMTSSKNFPTDYGVVRDLAKFPELVFLNRFDMIVPLLLGLSLLGLGEALRVWAPGLGTSGWQLVVWGFFISTVFLLHGTLMINSLAHVAGTRRFKTEDDSRNNLILALITLGEGWHNNHHRFMSSVRQGFYWWEIDVTFYILKMLSWLGIVWELKGVPPNVYAEAAGTSPGSRSTEGTA
ncbi:MAG: acyl-CoA desaturase [Verrucomicrobia bacterium]|nr:acyl-CoA desaturase [Verrucomicrobiota bacterium]